MKKNYLLLLLLLCSFLGYTQRKESHVCGSDELHIHMSKDKVYEAKTEKINNFWRKTGGEIKPKSGGMETNSIPSSPITLQVVFHDMNTGVSPLDYADIVAKLNTVYSGGVLSPLIANGATLPNKPGMPDTQIRFCLALQDANGNTYTAAESQHSTSITSFSPSNVQAINTLVNDSQSSAGFPTTKYINIYIVNNISGNTAGFATMPYAHGTLIDGIYIERAYLTPTGPDATNLNYNLNVLAHEMGHFLGLFHTFGICSPDTINELTDENNYNACSCNNDDCLFNGDMVCDTPPNMLIDSGYTCGTPPNSCNTDNMPTGPLDVADDKGNYMDYGNYYCQNHFTTGQVERMHFMIDPVTGPRKSLIVTSCTNCNSLDNCSFTINPNITGNQAIQGSSINFSAVSAPGCGLTGSGLTYTWSLLMAGNTTPVTATGVNYNPTGLTPGNYVLTLKAANASNSQCFEIATYSFKVIPVAGTCLLPLPSNNNNWGAWDRVTYQNGWSRNLQSSSYPYIYTNTIRTEVPAGPDAGQNFDIIPSTSFNDPNFLGISVPSGITSIMRVGPKLGNGTPISPGNGSYVSVTFHPTANNCKFRIHTLGLREATPNQYIAYLPAINNANNSTAAFGYVCQYLFDSPISTDPGQNTTMGMSENGLLVPGPTPGSLVLGSSVYGLNDMVSERHNSNSAVFTTAGTYRKMNQWTSQVLDFSEFVNLNTDITITFFAHTNDAVDALYSAYAYFGIECLGGGVPNDITLDLPDVSLSCAYQKEESCIEIPLPRPNYAVSHAANSTGLDWLTPSRNLAKVNLSKLEGGVYVPVQYVQPAAESIGGYMEYSLRICLDDNDAPFEDYRVEYITLNKTLTDDFRVFKGFFYNDPPCPGAGPYGGTVPSGTQKNIVWCPGSSLPTLTLTDPCIPGPNYQYQWFVKEDNHAIPYATGAALPPSLYSPYTVHCTRSFVRKVRYTDPYCGAETWLESDTYTIYNLGGITYETHNITKNDVCLFSNNTTVNINFSLTTSANCGSFAPPPGLPSANSVSAQLSYNGQPIGSPIIANYVGYAPLYLFQNQLLSFNNNTVNGPILGVGSHALTLVVTALNYGCTTVYNIPGFVTINVKESPDGGSIQLDHECIVIDINSTNHGVTNEDFGYAWEYSQTPNGPFQPVPGASNIATLSGFSLASYSLPLYIRRKSFGFDTCPEDVYSNVIQVNAPQTVPTFSFPLSICSSEPAPALPLISDNGIAGTWSPSAISNTVGQTYTFTPNSDQCTNKTATVTTTIAPMVTPFFSISEDLCNRYLPLTLPTISNNGVAGTWNPPVVQASGTYTFTPSGQCTQSVTLNITVSSEMGSSMPYFTNIPTLYCLGDTASPFPAVSANGHTGTWTLATPDTSIVGTTNYMFTSDQGACSFAWVSVTVVPPGIPEFDIKTVICPGDYPPNLPTTSLNGVPGTWSPQFVSPTLSNNYTFTPTSNCNPPVSVFIHVLDTCEFQIFWSADVSCQQAGEDPRPVQDIVDGPCIRVCEGSTVTYYLYGFNIASVDWLITGGTIIDQSNFHVEITWGDAAFCALQGTIHLVNGEEVTIDKCIEKLNSPRAHFAVMPGPGMNGCLDSPVHFQNLTTVNVGSDILYYNWDFGDGYTSTEFEPSHTYTSIGTYTVRLTAFNGCSCISTQVLDITISESDTIPITCEGVVCEGQTSIYSIPANYSGCEMVWSAIGGEVVWYNSDKTKAEIFWNQADDSGFGYVSVYSPDCFPCPSTLRVPIVKQLGTITGNIKMCSNSQSIYSLPKWPTTEYNWELLDNGTGAVLRYNNQRNEVIVDAGSSGDLKLKCTYYNTLLRCGGTASFTITVKPKLSLYGLTEVCRNIDTHFTIKDENFNTVSATWMCTGPNGYSLSNSASEFDIAFPAEGIYNFEILDPEFCMEYMAVKVLPEPMIPEEITGPAIACSGIAVEYTCTVPSGYNAVWNVENGDIVGSNIGEKVTVIFGNQPDPYIVSVSYEKDLCLSQPYSITVQRILPNLELTVYEAEVCRSSYATYKVADEDLELYSWSVIPENAGSVFEGQNENEVTILWNHTPQNAMLHLKARKCGALYETDYPVIITTGPTPTINGPAQICNGNAETFNLTFSVPTTFTKVIWDFGNGATHTVLGSAANPTSVTYTYNYPSESEMTYTITAKIEGANNCGIELTDSFDITISPSPQASVTPTTKTNLCSSSEPITYTIVQQDLGTTSSIQWYKTGVGPLSGETSETFLAASHGVGGYYAIVTNTQLSCSKTTNTVYVVNDCEQGSGGNCIQYLPEIATALTCGEDGLQLIAYIAGIESEDMPESTTWNLTPPGTIVYSNNFQYAVEGLDPGMYTLTNSGVFTVNGEICRTPGPSVDVVIPYKPDLSAKATCIGGGLYKVELTDTSLYYPLAGVEGVVFSTDGGETLYDASLNGNGVASFVTNLPAGTYSIGIGLWGSEYPTCFKYITLELAAYPQPQFTSNIACEGSATQFTITNPQPEWTYLWDFGNGATNAQENPVRTFTGTGPFPVSLSVTNNRDCTTIVTGSAIVNEVNINGGGLTASPVTACAGTPVTLTYTPSPGGSVPSAYQWNKVGGGVPVITTTPNFTVTQNGTYYVYVQDANGCFNYETPPITVSFVPSPMPPVISGDSAICQGESATLSIKPADGISYTWYSNGTQLSQWNEIVVTPSNPGTYQYSCIAMSSENGVNCYSQPSYFTVEVFPLPNMPDIYLQSFTCDPYEAVLTVSNPQMGATYYWSNGQTGTSTTITHDGPVQVRAEMNGCTVTAQTDLPVDLATVAWIFPKGCYDACRQADTKEIVGPAGEYTQWSWQENNSNVVSGSGQLSAFSGLTGGNNYQLYLNNGYCDMTIEDMSLIAADCKGCQISVNVEAVYSVIIDEVCLYEIKFTMYNPNSGNMWVTLTAPDGEGFFMGSTVMIPPGTSYPVVQFFPLNGFTGGSVFVEIESQWEEENCYIKYSIDFPELCVAGRPATATDTVTASGATETTVDMLIAAPNPASQVATIYYGYAHEGKNKTIEIFDTLGRPLMQYNANNSKGSFQLDCSLYSRGQYLVIMKADDEVIKTTRLIVINK